MSVSASDVESFDRDGFLIVPDLIDRARVERLSAAMDRVYAGEYRNDIRPPPLRKRVTPFGNESSVHWILNARWLDEDIWANATDARLGGMAAKLLGTPSVSIVEDQLLDKPDGGMPVNMHQDYGYWSFSRSTKMITCWIALVDMEASLGPVEILRGSHRWGRGGNPRDLILGSEDAYMHAADSARPEGAGVERVRVHVPAGGGAFFHSLTFHGSGRNESGRRRRAVSLHWASEECRVDLAKTRAHDHPYMFAKLTDNGPLVNKYMPRIG